MIRQRRPWLREEIENVKYFLSYLHTRRACGHVDKGTCPHQVLVATLTLSQPGGADYAHPILVSTPSYESHRRACMYCEKYLPTYIKEIILHSEF